MRQSVFMVGVLTAVLFVGPQANAQEKLLSARGPLIGAEKAKAVPLPPGFRVMATELDGPVFADSRGMTLYKWQLKALRNGSAGERKSEPACYDVKTTETAGLMSPYPPGLVLPELETRPACTDLWAPVLASGDAQPIEKWTVVPRKDGAKQWAYDGFALYTSVLDTAPGEVAGAPKKPRGDSPSYREPVQPPSDVPPAFEVRTTTKGRLLVTNSQQSVYFSDKDGTHKSNCVAECAKTWQPILAPQVGQVTGDWSVFERSPGVRQWAFRGKPMYINVLDRENRSQEGSDVPGWHNVYTQLAPPPPKDFTTQVTSSGEVLADATGKTIYTYACADDSVDQLSCDHPTDTQAYRLGMCGGGDPDRCLTTFPYVLASKGAVSTSQSWTVVHIDPKTGRYARPEEAGALRVWAYRQRPVYTYAGDKRPGDINADGFGEFRGMRNGFKAFWLRDDFYNGAG
jgi:predicted lipoprotein with Yx(FWY)xxD motif